MNYQDCLDLIRRSVPEWNETRRRDIGIRPNLASAKLTSLDLHQANFNEANLISVDFTDSNLGQSDFTLADATRAKFVHANLQKANLAAADFSEANLVEADLRAANLTNANLTNADMRRADLTGASLVGTNLTGANLAGATLANATVQQTLFYLLDLSSVLGLDACVHRGPSPVDYRTLVGSGPLPLKFLRGCGLSDRFIDYLPSLIETSPLRFYSCFISYSTADEEFAERLHADLQDNGIRCWFAPHDMEGGRKIYDQVDQAIRLYERLLLILSAESMSSSWVKTEIVMARQKEIEFKRTVLFPLRLVPFDDIRAWKQFDADLGEDIAKTVRELFTPDFSQWKDHDVYRREFQRLVKALREP